MDRLTVLILALTAGFGVTSATEFNCERSADNVFPTEVCYVPDCTNAIKTHIQYEFNAAFKYMYMGSYFAQDSVNRPGITKFLLEAASEERGHAIQMLDYLNLRGIWYTDSYAFAANSSILDDMSFKAALEESLNMEIEVTNLIYDVVEKCGTDFHGADVFTNPILDEQHNGVRKLQGAVRAFNDLISGQTEPGKALAEYIFDKKMLSGDF